MEKLKQNNDRYIMIQYNNPYLTLEKKKINKTSNRHGLNLL